MTSSKAERGRGARLEEELHVQGLADARVTVLARAKGGAVLRIELLSVAARQRGPRRAIAVSPAAPVSRPIHERDNGEWIVPPPVE